MRLVYCFLYPSCRKVNIPYLRVVCCGAEEGLLGSCGIYVATTLNPPCPYLFYLALRAVDKRPVGLDLVVVTYLIWKRPVPLCLGYSLSVAFCPLGEVAGEFIHFVWWRYLFASEECLLAGLEAVDVLHNRYCVAPAVGVPADEFKLFGVLASQLHAKGADVGVRTRHLHLVAEDEV